MGKSEPRRRNAAKTRDAVLAAACFAFAAKGYTQVGLREIAHVAGADPALVRRYFGSKVGLFEAVLNKTMNLEDLLDAPRDEIGRYIAGLLIDKQAGRTNPIPILLMAMADPEVRDRALAQIEERVITPLAAWLGGPNAEARAVQISMLCSGFLTYSKLLPLPLFDLGIDNYTFDWFSRAIQACCDGD